MGFTYIATPAATDEASDALLAEGQSADADAAAASAPTAAAAVTAVAAPAAPPTSLPVTAPTTTSTDLDLFGGQSPLGIACRPEYKAYLLSPIMIL